MCVGITRTRWSIKQLINQIVDYIRAKTFFAGKWPDELRKGHVAIARARSRILRRAHLCDHLADQRLRDAEGRDFSVELIRRLCLDPRPATVASAIASSLTTTGAPLSTIATLSLPPRLSLTFILFRRHRRRCRGRHRLRPFITSYSHSRRHRCKIALLSLWGASCAYL